VTPPKPGGGPRITVQIAPQPAPPAEAPQTAALPAPDGAPAQTRYPWFWEAVPPGLGAATGPVRLEAALRSLGAPPPGQAVAAPRLGDFRRIIDRHGVDILTATVGTRVSPALVLALISVESSGDPAAESHKGAQGLMQLIPETAERFGVSDPVDPGQNIRGGVAYLDWLMSAFDDDAVLALAGYNAGEGAVTQNAGVPPYTETRDYVPKVLAAYRVARNLCTTPPELVTDGCVFALRGD
jgi:soluble lytic murein transglycosylase-like protein